MQANNTTVIFYFFSFSPSAFSWDSEVLPVSDNPRIHHPRRHNKETVRLAFSNSFFYPLRELQARTNLKFIKRTFKLDCHFNHSILDHRVVWKHLFPRHKVVPCDSFSSFSSLISNLISPPPPPWARWRTGWRTWWPRPCRPAGRGRRRRATPRRPRPRAPRFRRATRRTGRGGLQKRKQGVGLVVYITIRLLNMRLWP